MESPDPVAPLLDIATGALADEGVVAAWRRWRSARPELDDVSAAELVVLPAAWDRMREAGGEDVDAARLDGLRRNAALTTAVTLARVAEVQSVLRHAGVPSAVAGGVSVVLLGAASPGQRGVRGAEVWVARSDFASAREVLGGVGGNSGGAGRVLGGPMGGWWVGMRAAITGSAALAGYPGVVLRSRLPTLPPVDAQALVAARQQVHWSGTDVEVLGPTEAVFADEVMGAARRAALRVRHPVGALDKQQVAAVEVGRVLDSRFLGQLGAFDAGRLQRLRQFARWAL